MGNQVIKEFLKSGNDQDKNEYIRDLSNSICTYVKTGDRNELLDNFLIYAVEIKHEIKQTFVEKEKIDSPKHMEIEWNNCMKKIMYLSHLNMLYDMYMQEMQLKEEQKKFIKASREFPKLFKIVTEINKQRRMDINKLKGKFSLSDAEYNYIIIKYKRYFNFRKDKNKQIIQISLSPNGKNYLLYMRDKQSGISQTQVDLIVRNCEAVIKSIPISLTKRLPHRVEFCGLMPETERSLQFTYDQMIFEVKRTECVSYPIYDLSERKCFSNVKENYSFSERFIK